MIFAETLAGGNDHELQAARESLQLCAGDAVLVEYGKTMNKGVVPFCAFCDTLSPSK